MRACVCFYKKIDFFFDKEKTNKTHYTKY